MAQAHCLSRRPQNRKILRGNKNNNNRKGSYIIYGAMVGVRCGGLHGLIVPSMWVFYELSQTSPLKPILGYPYSFYTQGCLSLQHSEHGVATFQILPSFSHGLLPSVCVYLFWVSISKSLPPYKDTSLWIWGPP